MDDFLEQIEQDIRQEKIWQIWKKHKKLITWGTGALLVSAAVWNMWSWNQHKQQVEWSELFVRAHMLLDQGKTDEAMRYLNNLEGTKSSYATLSSFIKASFYSAEGDNKNIDTAVKSYESIIQSKSVSADLREYAMLRLVLAKLDQPNPDLAGLLSEVKKLSGEKNFWPLLAQEVEGMILIMMEKYDDARQIFLKIAQNNEASPAMRSRAQLLSRHSNN